MHLSVRQVTTESQNAEMKRSLSTFAADLIDLAAVGTTAAA